jgi:hypothetical protein
MAYKRASTLVGLPDQDRGWEDVQVCVHAVENTPNAVSYVDSDCPNTSVISGKDVLQVVSHDGRVEYALTS